MLNFVQSWFTPAANPIGVDFGTDALRMAQVEAVAPAAAADAGPRDYRLVAAARADVPAAARNDPAARLAFFAATVRELWARGNFRGRRAVLALPAASMAIQHVRLARMDEDATRKALPWEARGKLPYDPTHALLRHVVAGEIHADGEPRNEVILFAAEREMVNQFLAAAGRAKLDVVGMNVEPKAVVDCFGHVYRRATDAAATQCFVDIGCGSTRAFVARGPQVLFARSIPVGGDHLNRAVAVAMRTTVDEAKALRVRLAQEQHADALIAPPAARDAQADRAGESPCPEAAFVAAGADDGPAAASDASRVAAACRDTVARLVDELALCRRYHEATFPERPIDRLIFVGGEARHRALCQAIARGLDLAAQVGDPMARMARISDVRPESGIDRRLPQPDWAIAFGLSMGPVAAAVPAAEPLAARAG